MGISCLVISYVMPGGKAVKAHCRSQPPSRNHPYQQAPIGTQYPHSSSIILRFLGKHGPKNASPKTSFPTAEENGRSLQLDYNIAPADSLKHALQIRLLLTAIVHPACNHSQVPVTHRCSEREIKA